MAQKEMNSGVANPKGPRLADLFIILYRPRETMRRILDAERDRWAVAMVILAFVCASVSDIDAYRLTDVDPNLKLLSALAIVALLMVVGACTWIVMFFIVSWIARPIGRMLGGTASAAGLRAALAWSLAPIVWSPVYRIPFVLLMLRFPTPREANVRRALLDFVAHGGCSIFVLYLSFQLLFFIACLIVGSNTVAEAQRFSTQKGFINVMIAIAVPVLVIAAAMFTFSKR